MIKIRRFLKISARIASSACVMVFLCAFAFFAVTSAFVTEESEPENVIHTLDASAARVSDIEYFVRHVRNTQGALPGNERVRNLSPVHEETEALRISQVYSVSFESKYGCVCGQGEYSASGRGGRNILSNIKNKFYCRI